MGFTKKVSPIHQDPTSQLTRLKGSGTRHHRTSLGGVAQYRPQWATFVSMAEGGPTQY